jgi:hypothetical protein
MYKRGQITVFIIIGILFLALTFGLFMIINSTTQLAQEEQKIYADVLQQEGLRLYVEDCLEDPLQDALELIGKQGRIWDDQPGGITEFNEDTGVQDIDTRVYYGIRKETHSASNVYPCNTGNNPPTYCKYSYPDISVEFGRSQRAATLVKGDIERYLRSQTKKCVQEFIKDEISTEAELQDTEFTLSVTLQDDSLLVDAIYPLKFKIQGKEFFSNSKFDMLKKTNLQRFLKSVVEPSIRFEKTYVDFTLNTDTLNEKSFTYQQKEESAACIKEKEDLYTCTFPLASPLTNLNAKLETKELANGDKIYQFSSDDFSYTFAVQNRPPALDYVHRDECPVSYDYLVDKDNPSVDITLNAKDPDDDEITYEIGNLPPGLTKDNDKIQGTPTENKVHDIVVKAKDAYGEDWQKIRVAVCTNPTPVLGCFGKNDLTLGTNFIQENAASPCGDLVDSSCIKEKETEIATLICGDTPECNPKIPAACKGKPSYHYEGKSACFGTFGCEELCPDPIAWIGAGPGPGKLPSEYANGFQDAAKDPKTLGFACGCTTQPDDTPCDLNYNGLWEGHCLNKKCELKTS